MQTQAPAGLLRPTSPANNTEARMGAVHAVRYGIAHDDVLIIDDGAAGLRRRLAKFDEAWWHVLALRTSADVGRVSRRLRSVGCSRGVPRVG